MMIATCCGRFAFVSALRWDTVISRLLGSSYERLIYSITSVISFIFEANYHVVRIKIDFTHFKFIQKASIELGISNAFSLKKICPKQRYRRCKIGMNVATNI